MNAILTPGIITDLRFTAAILSDATLGVHRAPITHNLHTPRTRMRYICSHGGLGSVTGDRSGPMPTALASKRSTTRKENYGYCQESKEEQEVREEVGQEVGQEAG
jgi:hypothetical protein